MHKQATSVEEHEPVSGSVKQRTEHAASEPVEEFASVSDAIQYFGQNIEILTREGSLAFREGENRSKRYGESNDGEETHA